MLRLWRRGFAWVARGRSMAWLRMWCVVNSVGAGKVCGVSWFVLRGCTNVAGTGSFMICRVGSFE